MHLGNGPSQRIATGDLSLLPLSVPPRTGQRADKKTHHFRDFLLGGAELRCTRVGPKILISQQTGHPLSMKTLPQWRWSLMLPGWPNTHATSMAKADARVREGSCDRDKTKLNTFFLFYSGKLQTRLSRENRTIKPQVHATQLQ